MHLAYPYCCFARWVCCIQCVFIQLPSRVECAEHYYRSQTPDGFLRYQRHGRFLQLLGTVAVILTILGIYYKVTWGHTMRLVGVILFAVLYIVLVGICLYLWTQIRFLMQYRKQVSFSKHRHLSDSFTYILSSALEGCLCRTSIPNSSNGLRCPVHTSLGQVSFQHWPGPGRIWQLADLYRNIEDAHGVCCCDHLLCCRLQAASQRRLQDSRVV